MAAVLCSVIGDICKGVCDALSVPCKVCNLGCASLSEVFSSPFCPYLTVTFALNLPAVVYGLKSLISSCDNDYSNLTNWLVGNALLSILHMAGAVYITNTIRNTDIENVDKTNLTGMAPAVTDGGVQVPSTTNNTDTSKLAPAVTGVTDVKDGLFATPTGPASPPTATVSAVEEGRQGYQNFYTTGNTGGERSRGSEMSYKRVKHVLCYDKVTAVYILIFIGWMIWLTIGFARRINAFANADFADYDEGCLNYGRYMNVEFICGYLYMCLVGIAFCCSLCCLKN